MTKQKQTRKQKQITVSKFPMVGLPTNMTILGGTMAHDMDGNLRSCLIIFLVDRESGPRKSLFALSENGRAWDYLCEYVEPRQEPQGILRDRTVRFFTMGLQRDVVLKLHHDSEGNVLETPERMWNRSPFTEDEEDSYIDYKILDEPS